jgi:gas vesicle protein
MTDMKRFFIFAAGAAVGAAVALLLAPKSGEEMREELKDMAQDATKRAQDAAKRAHGYCEQVKKDLEEAAAAVKKEA